MNRNTMYLYVMFHRFITHINSWCDNETRVLWMIYLRNNTEICVGFLEYQDVSPRPIRNYWCNINNFLNGHLKQMENFRETWIESQGCWSLKTCVTYSTLFLCFLTNGNPIFLQLGHSCSTDPWRQLSTFNKISISSCNLYTISFNVNVLGNVIIL